MNNNSEQEDLMKQIYSIVYPSYPFGCSPQEFLTHYEPLFDALQRFDRATDLSVFHEDLFLRLKGISVEQNSKQQEEITDHIIMKIIDVLNSSCSHCHRKQYSQRVFQKLSSFTGKLKDLAVGKTKISISGWGNLLDIENPASLYYGIKQHEVLSIYDKLYQNLHYIPNRQTFMLNYTKVIVAQDKFQKALKQSQNNLPHHHQLYIAIIASATYGSKYLWSRSVSAFLKAGGDINWILKGNQAIPVQLKQISKFSTLVAYNFKQLSNQNIFGANNSLENEYKLIALIWICYYQALACIDLVCGFTPQKAQNLQYLPNLPTVRPSLGSFEAVKRTSGMDSLHELRAAEQFANIYSWDSEGQQQIQVRIQGARSIGNNTKSSNSFRRRVESLPDIRQNHIYLLGHVQSQQILQKISNLQSLQYLKSIFNRYAHFQPINNNFGHKIQSKLVQQSIILASDWDFQLKGLNRIQSVLGSKVRQSLYNLISAMRVQNNQKSKQLKHYYQFFNNYMYEYESYTKLIKSLTINERNYLKLVTKSPFLFTQQAFLRMKNDLSKVGIDSLDFIMEAVSFKLELSVNLLSFLFDKAFQQLS